MIGEIFLEIPPFANISTVSAFQLVSPIMLPFPESSLNAISPLLSELVKKCCRSNVRDRVRLEEIVYHLWPMLCNEFGVTSANPLNQAKAMTWSTSNRTNSDNLTWSTLLKHSKEPSSNVLQLCKQSLALSLTNIRIENMDTICGIAEELLKKPGNINNTNKFDTVWEELIIPFYSGLTNVFAIWSGCVPYLIAGQFLENTKQVMKKYADHPQSHVHQAAYKLLWAIPGNGLTVSDLMKCGKDIKLQVLCLRLGTPSTEMKLLLEALKSISSLTYLDLKLNSIGDADCISLCDSFKYIPSLTTLDLTHNSIGAAGCKSLCESFKYIPSLTTLNLSVNAIGDAGCISLAESLKHLPSLIYFYLYGNPIGDAGHDLQTYIATNYPHLQFVV